MSIVVNKESPKSLDLKTVFKESLPFLLLAIFLFVCGDAMAQSGGGFGTEAETMIKNIRNGIVIIVGVICTIALIWTFLQGVQGKKTWGDVLEISLWIFGAGAAVAAATWIFLSGQKISFS